MVIADILKMIVKALFEIYGSQWLWLALNWALGEILYIWAEIET